MGYDIHGTEPTAPEGVYFRRSNLAWPPLAALCRELVPEFAEHSKYWTSTQGAGLTADMAAQFAARLQQLIADGTVADYIGQLRAMLARRRCKTCAGCEGAGRISRAVVKTADSLPGPLDKDGYFICLACAGAGRVKPLSSGSLLDEEDVNQWVSFLQKCGGFCIL
jgi:hypothetical protein